MLGTIAITSRQSFPKHAHTNTNSICTLHIDMHTKTHPCAHSVLCALDPYRVCVRMHVPLWSGVRWQGGLHLGEQLSLCLQWKHLYTWGDTFSELQPMVCLKSIFVYKK